MSSVSRIKSLMMITEQSFKKVVTPSVNIDALITMLLFLKEKNPEMFEDINEFEDVDFTKIYLYLDYLNLMELLKIYMENSY